METQETREKKEKKGMPVVPILVTLVLIGVGGFWLISSNPSKKGTAVAVNKTEQHKEEKHEDDDGHDEDDGHGHDEGHDEHGDEEGHDELGLHDALGEHEEHGGHDEHEDEGIKLSDAEMTEFGIRLAKANAGSLHHYVNLPGEIRANGDRLAHLVPRVSGVVRKVFKGLGDRVKKGEVMALLDSRELSDGKADFLAALERVALAQANFNREESLRKKLISSGQEYLEAKQVLAEAQIERRSAEQKLHALGFSKRYLNNLPKHPEESFTRYELLAPFNGRIIEKHITLGEVLRDDTRVFIIADLSTVWVDLSVYQKDLLFIEKGQSALIEATQGTMKTSGKIAYVGSIIGEETRTALARIVIPNKEGQWRPGLFVNAKIAVGEINLDLIVPKSAIQKMKDQDVLFVMEDGELKPQPVKLGQSDASHVEIIEGIHRGDTYVAEGGFTLRAQLGKGELGHGHSH